MISTQVVPFIANAKNSFVVFPKTSEALPGNLTNALESQPRVAPQRFAELILSFDTPFAFVLDQTRLSLPHGSGLFFDAGLSVLSTGEQIHNGDLRMLSVPSGDWLWPEESVRIDQAYPKVSFMNGTPPTIIFSDLWWTQPNHCVYDGVVCGTR